MATGVISAGSYDLNKWLYGGYENDIITTLYGGPGSGKTNFCVIVAVSQAKKGNNVLFIDTEGGFSLQRVKQLAGDDYENVLKHIFVLKPTSFSEQQHVFQQLGTYLKKEISLIVVDSMTMLYRLEFAAAREKGTEFVQKANAGLASQMRVLAEIARTRNIPVIITNQVYRWDQETKMIAGDVLRYWSKCLIELTHTEGRRTAYLRKHRSLPEKKLDFQITNEGIRKKGWL